MGQFISEDDIDKVFEEMSTKESLQEKWLRSFTNQQPHIAAWLLGESFELLTDEEKDLLFFLAMVIYEASKRKNGTLPEVDGESLRDAEELNWQIMEDVKATTFRDRMSIFFDDTEQEDVLAFIEDSLVEDEDDEPIVTKVGREPMFLGLKTVADVLT